MMVKSLHFYIFSFALIELIISSKFNFCLSWQSYVKYITRILIVFFMCIFLKFMSSEGKEA